MDNSSFEKRLKSIGLTKKEFSRLVNMSYGSIVNWGRASQNVPVWVDSWLELYEKSRKFEKLRQALVENGICEQLGEK